MTISLKGGFTLTFFLSFFFFFFQEKKKVEKKEKMARKPAPFHFSSRQRPDIFSLFV